MYQQEQEFQEFDATGLFAGAGEPFAVGRVGNRVVIACQAPGGRSSFIHQMRLWDFETRKALGPWIADDKGFEKAAIGEFDGNPVIACGGKGGIVRLWDAASGNLFGSLDIGGPWIEALALHDSNVDLVVVVSGGSRAVRAWSVRAREPLISRFDQWDGLVYAVAAGDLYGDPVIAAIDRKGVYLWSLTQGSLVRDLPSGEGAGYALAIANLDGRPMIISICEEHGEVYSLGPGRPMSSSYSVVRLWDLSKDPASGRKLTYPITRARGVTAGRVSGKTAIMSIYDTGEIWAWYPSTY